VADFLFVIVELFRYFLRLSGYKRKAVEVGVFRREGSLWTQISDGRGHCPPTTVGIRKQASLSFRVVSKCRLCIVWFCHKARV